MDGIDKFLNYIDEKLESIIQGHSSDVEAAELELPVARQIKHKLERLGSNFSEIYELVHRLDDSRTEQRLPGGDGRYATQLQELLSAVERRINELERAYVTDEMTGLMNRYHGEKAIEKRLAEDFSKEGSCLVFIDIDHLKQVNDIYGHSEGDLYIKRMAGAISSSVRRSDIAIRYGGDEFLIFFSNCSKKAAEERMCVMRDTLGSRGAHSTYPYLMSFSCGIVNNREDPALNVWDLINIADGRMYLQKRQHTMPGESA